MAFESACVLYTSINIEGGDLNQNVFTGSF